MDHIPALRTGHPADPDLVSRRGQMQAAVEAGAWRTARPALATTLAGRRCLRFKPEGTPRGFMLHLHGGGFRIGMPEFASHYAAALVERLGIEVVVPQYGLTPEHPFPGGLTDASETLQALCSEVGDAPLIVSGDSAGGGLAASLGLLHGDRITALVLLSPWLDLRVIAPSYASNATTDPLFSKESADVAAELYLQGFDPTHPLVSPLLAEISAYPPAFISIGSGEVLYDDATRFHATLQQAGCTCQLSVIDGMEHVAVVRGMNHTGAEQTLNEICQFIASDISQTTLTPRR